MIYNDDGFSVHNKKPITSDLDERELDERVNQVVDETVDSGVDLFLLSTAYHRPNYPSQVWEPCWEEYKEKGTFNGENVDPETAKKKSFYPMMILARTGRDFHQRISERCKERGIAYGASIRMDDKHHDGPLLGIHSVSEELAEFYKNPKNYLVDSNRSRGVALNYERKEVREHYLALIREMVERYEMDVMELDFMRLPPFFPRGDVEKYCGIMTDFMRQVDEVCHEADNNISVLPRIPSTPANCRELGLDIEAWSKEGLICGLALAMKNCTPWDLPVEKFRRITGDEVPLYTGLERSAGRAFWADNVADGEKAAQSSTRWNRELFKGFAAGRLARGADGIYLFNFFLQGNKQYFDVLEEMKSLDGLRGRPKAYRSTTFGATIHVEADLPEQFPVEVPGRRARRFDISLAEEPESSTVTAHVILDRSVDPDEAWLQLNEYPLGKALEVRTEPPTGRKIYSWWDIVEDAAAVVFNVPPKAMRDGLNHVVYRNESVSNPVKVLGIAVSVE